MMWRPAHSSLKPPHPAIRSKVWHTNHYDTMPPNMHSVALKNKKSVQSCVDYDKAETDLKLVPPMHTRWEFKNKNSVSNCISHAAYYTVPAGGIAALHTCNVRVVHAVYTDLTCDIPKPESTVMHHMQCACINVSAMIYLNQTWR